MKKILIVLLSFVVPVFAVAQTAEQRGLKIAQEGDRRETGFVDTKADMTMLLKNRNGDESVRYIRIRTLEVDGDGDKSMSIFDRPFDVKGTAFLSYSHKSGQDDQWLYLPALKRVKRIASRNKSGSFMGSEFSFEDMSSQEVEKYTYKYLRDETCGEAECFIIERYPEDKYSGYSRQVAWVDKKEVRVEKIVFYDRKNALLKTLTFKDYKKYLNQFWRADKMFMENHQTGKSTLLSWENYKFKNGFTKRDFDKSSLKRAR